jgi:hypothetical protein
MFHKLYLAGASPPRLPGAGPGLLLCAANNKPTYTVLKENEHGY